LNPKNVFGDRTVDNRIMHRDTICHVEIDKDNTPQNNNNEVMKNIDFVGVDNKSNSQVVTEDDLSNMIDIINKSRARFSQYNQKRSDIVCRFYYVFGLPSNIMIKYAAETYSILNLPITRKDIDIAINMLGPSCYIL